MTKINIIIDTSYCVYYTGFSVWNWYKNTFNVLPDKNLDPMLDPEFRSEYENKFYYRLANLTTKHCPLSSFNDMCFAVDCHRDNVWRRDIYSSYKILRKEKQDKTKEFSWSGIYKYVYDILLPKYKENYGVKVVKAPRAESDDIIGVLVKHIMSNDYNIIVTNDYDMCQLLSNATIINFDNVIINNDKMKEKYGVDTVQKFVVMKSLMGDSGDEIPAVHPRCGVKTALKYIEDTSLLKEKMKENPEIEKNFKRNYKLVSFDCIPGTVKSDIIELYQAELTNGNLTI